MPAHCTGHKRPRCRRLYSPAPMSTPLPCPGCALCTVLSKICLPGGVCWVKRCCHPGGGCFPAEGQLRPQSFVHGRQGQRPSLRQTEHGQCFRLVPAVRRRADSPVQNGALAPAEGQKACQFCGVCVPGQPCRAAGKFQRQRRARVEPPRLTFAKERTIQRQQSVQHRQTPAGIREPGTVLCILYLCNHLSALTIFLNSRPRTSKLGYRSKEALAGDRMMMSPGFAAARASSTACCILSAC